MLVTMCDSCLGDSRETYAFARWFINTVALLVMASMALAWIWVFGGKTPFARRVIMDLGSCSSCARFQRRQHTGASFSWARPGRRAPRRTSIGIVTASLGCPPPPVFFSSSLLFSDGVDCEWSAPDACPAAADDDVGLRGWTASGVCARPGGGRLGGGIEVSIEGFASPGDGVGIAEATGEASIGANLADEAEASLLRAESLLRDDMVRIKRASSRR